MAVKTVTLYTRQNDKTLRQLERDGRIINHRAYVEMHFGDIAPLFMESYDWFTKEAAKRVPKPEDVHAPIWCSISPDNCLKPIEFPMDLSFFKDDIKECIRRKKREFERAGNVHFALINGLSLMCVEISGKSGRNG